MSGAIRRAALACALCVLAATATAAPAGVVFINDTALHRYDRALAASIGIFQQATGIQMGVVLAGRLPPGQTIERQAADVFQKSGLGRAFGGNGILLLWVESQREFKIEVGYGLEGAFPDLLCQQLEEAARSAMAAPTPYAQRDFLTELMVTMRIHYLDWRATGRLGQPAMPGSPGSHALSTHLSGGAGITVRDYAGALSRTAAMQAPLDAGTARQFAPARTPRETLLLYLMSLQQGVGSPLLPLLSESGLYFRMERPYGAAHAKRIGEYYRRAMPFTVREQGDLAVGTFQPGQPVLPVFMRRDPQGNWRVDEAAGSAYFQLAEQGGSAIAKYAQFPYAWAWSDAPPSQALFANRAVVPALIPDLPAHGLKERLALLQGRAASAGATADDLVALAQLLHFGMYWIDAAAPLYELALTIAPQRDDVRWMLVDVSINTSDLDAQERHLRVLATRTPRDAMAAHYLSWFARMYPR